MGLFQKTPAIDYRNNPMMVEFLTAVQEQKINRYAICLDALCTNFRLSPNGVEAFGGDVFFYADRGYQMLTKAQAKSLSRQIFDAVSALPNVKKVEHLRYVASHPRQFRDMTAKDYRADFCQIEYCDPQAGLKAW